MTCRPRWYSPTADCRVSGDGLSGLIPTPISVKPGKYGGGSFASYRWVAYFIVPTAGTYVITCRPTGNVPYNAVGRIPQIPGAVGAMVHWPLPAIYLLGALPGLWMLTQALGIFVRRRADRRSEFGGPDH